MDQRVLRRLLLLAALLGLGAGVAATLVARSTYAPLAYAAGAAPVVAFLAFSILRDLVAGRMGVDAVALASMAGALALRENLACVIIAVMYAGGNLLEDFAVGRAERNLKALIDRAPRRARRKTGETIEEVAIEAVAVGDLLLVQAGEVVPVDGQICGADALVDESALTGEPLPVTRRKGQALRSGVVNAGEAFEMRAIATSGDSAYAGILRMASAARTAKAPFIRVADRYALLLLPLALGLAGLAWWWSGDPVRGLAVLVVATPCPLILAAPAAFVSGTSLAARRGVLIKGGGPLEALAHIRTVMFDKTGTLTVGGARLVAIETAPGVSASEALRLAASLEQASHHVLAKTIVATARGQGLRLSAPSEVRETLGSGLEGRVDARKICVGSLGLVRGDGRLEEWARRAARRAAWRSALSVFVAAEGRVVGVLLFADELRRETPRAIQMLRGLGVDRIVMLTGDRAEAAETIAAALDLNAVLAERVPSDKLDAVVGERRQAPTLMVGDGINDAPALAAATVGIAMGASGASASSQAADVVILVDRLDRVPEVVAIARRTRAIAMQSVVAGMTLSGVAMIGAACGYLTPIAGALLQEAIDVAVILNALRALSPGGLFDEKPMPEAAATKLRDEHLKVEMSLERLRQIADALDSAEGSEAVQNILEARRIVESEIVAHEREDEATIYPRVSGFLGDAHGLRALSRAHREILHQARLLTRLADGLRPADAESYLVRDAQRIVESIESLVHIHNAQEEDIYDYATGHARHSARGVLWRLAAAGAVVAGLAAAALHWRDDLPDWAQLPERPAAREIVATAEIAAAHATRVESEVTGVLAAVSCELGAAVKAGDVCALIDPHPFEAAVERGKAALDDAQARLAAVKAESTQGAAPLEEEPAPAKGKTKTRRAKAKRAAKALGFGEDPLERRHAAIERITEEVAEREAAWRAALESLEATKILAPADGIIVARTAAPGARVQPGTGKPLFLLAGDIGLVRVTTRIDAAALGELRPGAAVVFTVDALPGQKFEGEVVQLAKSLRAGIELVIVARNTELALKPGTSVAIRLRAGR